MHGYRSDIAIRHSALRTPHAAREDGQSSIEYAVLIAIVIAAVLGMAVYTKRALDGKWREVGDAMGYGRQYEPGVTK